VDENKRPLGMIRQNIYRRKSYQRICGNTHFMTIKVKFNIHKTSVQEMTSNANFVILPQS